MDDKPRPALGLKIYFPNVFPNDTQAKRLDATYKANDADNARPARHGRSHESIGDCPDNADEAESASGAANSRHDSEWLHGKAGNAIDCQAEHLSQRIMATSRHSLIALIRHGGRWEAD